MLPTVTFDANKNDTYTFTLWRDGKKVVHEFKGFSVTINENNENVIHGARYVLINGIDERIILPADRAKLDGPAFDGTFYYITVQPFQGEDIMIWLSKDEAAVLQPIMDDIAEEEFLKNEYEFTRTTLNDMAKNPEKYGPEQLARAMSWDESDSHDAYREHPLDHE
jgi:hypothetical protein